MKIRTCRIKTRICRMKKEKEVMNSKPKANPVPL
jgi:hypothetical protein